MPPQRIYRDFLVLGIAGSHTGKANARLLEEAGEERGTILTSSRLGKIEIIVTHSLGVTISSLFFVFSNNLA